MFNNNNNNNNNNICQVSLSLIVAAKSKHTELVSNVDSLYNDLTIRQNGALFTLYFCACGFFFIGFWELNQHSKWHAYLHYLALPLTASGLATAALVLNGDVAFWSITIIFLLFVIAFALFNIFWGNGKKYPNNPKKVHTFSLINIGLELGWTGMAAICTVCGIYNLNNLDE